MFKARYRTIAKTDDVLPGSVIVLLGTALRGPAMEPIMVAGPDHARRVFGNEGTLLDGYRLVWAANPQASCFLMRVNGCHARLSLTLEGEEVLALTAIDAGADGNNIKISYDDDYLIVGFGEVINRYCLDELGSIGALVDRINGDAERGYSPVEAATSTVSLSASAVKQALPGDAYLTDGEDGYPLTKNELYVLLEQAYQKLTGMRADIVVPLGAYLNDNIESYTYGSLRSIYGAATYSSADVLDLTTSYGPASFVVPLVQFCVRQMSYGLMSHGVIGMRPMPDPAQIRPWRHRYVHDLVGAMRLNDTDNLYHISAVLGDLLFQGSHVSSAPVYAALLAQTGTETTTNRGFPGFIMQKAELDGESMRLAAAYGLVTWRYSLSAGHLVVCSGVTLAETGRPLHYIANVRTAQYIIHRLHSAVDPFIGTITGTIVVRDTLEQVADNLLGQLQQEGIIQKYSLITTLEPADVQQSLRCRFDLSFRPKYSLEDISLTVRHMV